jgi:hypothetical protein
MSGLMSGKRKNLQFHQSTLEILHLQCSEQRSSGWGLPSSHRHGEPSLVGFTPYHPPTKTSHCSKPDAFLNIEHSMEAKPLQEDWNTFNLKLTTKTIAIVIVKLIII